MSVHAAGVTIVVLNWNHAEETIVCLDSLRVAELGGASVLVVDNGSRDGSVAAIRARFPQQEILALPENVGFAGGNNAGIRHALARGAEAVLLLNNDTDVAPDFLPPLLEALNSNPRCAAVSSAVLRRDRPHMIDVA
jgi:GT2 family glycosyltransferase